MLCPHCPHQKVMTHLRKLEQDARLSQQAKEHLNNQAVQVAISTGPAKGERGDEDTYNSSELTLPTLYLPKCAPCNWFLYKSTRPAARCKTAFTSLG